VIALACLASNNGSSLRAIVQAIAAGDLRASLRLVVSNKREAPVLDFARAHGVPARHIPTVADPDRADARLEAELVACGAQLVVLSGYLRKLGPRVLTAFPGRVLNIHPGPLPRFGGEGMYGRRVHEAVLAAGVAVSGATVHLVDEVYDHGPVVARVEVPVLPGDTAQSLEARVMAAEPGLFVETLRRIADGRLDLMTLGDAV
jgi:phosphoribosylglycinamide formyltransferase-1